MNYVLCCFLLFIVLLLVSFTVYLKKRDPKLTPTQRQLDLLSIGGLCFAAAVMWPLTLITAATLLIVGSCGWVCYKLASLFVG